MQGLRLYSGRGVRQRGCQSTPKQMGEKEANPEHWLSARSSDGGGDPPHTHTPVHRFIMPMLLEDRSSSRHVGAPHNCLQSLHEVLAEFALQGRNMLPGSLADPQGPQNCPCGRRGGAGGGEGLPAPLASPTPPLTPPPRARGASLASGPTSSKSTLQACSFPNRIAGANVSVQKSCHLGKNKNKIHSTERGISGVL